MLGARKVALGIIGGMGVEAGRDFEKSVRAAGVESTMRFDSRHPDRVDWLEGKGRSPAPKLAGSISNMLVLAEKAVMACNTAHIALPEVMRLLPRWQRDRVIDMVTLTLDQVRDSGAMWLGTTVLTNSGILDGVELPSAEDQEIVQAAIWAAKRGEFPYSDDIRRIVSERRVVAGCTEMPMILREAGIVDFVDPAQIVADHVLH